MPDRRWLLLLLLLPAALLVVQVRSCTLRWLKDGNEAHAISVLRELTYRQSMYREKERDRGASPAQYASTLDPLFEIHPGETPLAAGISHGYSFHVVTATADTWAAVAIPIVPGGTGDRAYYVDETGVYRWRMARDGTPGPRDTRLGAEGPLDIDAPR